MAQNRECQLPQSTPQSERLLREFRSIVYDVTEQEAPSLGLDTEITDLGIESLTLYEVVCALERRYGMQFADGELAAIRTVGDLLGRAADASTSQPRP